MIMAFVIVAVMDMALVVMDLVFVVVCNCGRIGLGGGFDNVSAGTQRFTFQARRGKPIDLQILGSISGLRPRRDCAVWPGRYLISW